MGKHGGPWEKYVEQAAKAAADSRPVTPAERLLAAADLLDKRAGEAAKGPWVATDGGANNGCMWVNTPEHLHAFSFHGFPASGRYIATMHPEVGKALAKCLRSMAADFDHDVINDVTYVMDIADLLLAGAS